MFPLLISLNIIQDTVSVFVEDGIDAAGKVLPRGEEDTFMDVPQFVQCVLLLLLPNHTIRPGNNELYIYISSCFVQWVLFLYRLLRIGLN